MARMTSLLSPSRAGRRDPEPTGVPPRPVSLSGLLAAAHAAALGLLAVTVPVLVGWATAADSGASATEAVRTSLQAWLAGHLTTMAVPGGRFDLVPLGLTAVPALLLVAATARAARASAVSRLRGVAALTAVTASAYAVVAAVLALLARTDAVRPLPLSAFLGAGTVATLAAGVGALRGAGAGRRLWRLLPVPVRLAAVGGAGALGTLVAAGALIAALSLAIHHQRAGELLRGLDAGATGGVLVLLLCALYVPTAAVWGTAFVVGPGFSLGTGTAVSLGGVHLGAAPAFPLLAALPADGAVPRPLLGVLLAPVGAGVVAGLLVDRRDRAVAAARLTTWRRVLLAGAAVGAVAGAGLAVLSAAGSGAVGPGRLADVGPGPWLVGLAAAVEVGVLASVTLLVLRRDVLRAGRAGSLSE